jgi:hypothetical protein
MGCCYNRILPEDFVVAKWFKNPPSSFELIRKQGNAVDLSGSRYRRLLISLGVALILNWDHELAGALSLEPWYVWIGLNLNIVYFIVGMLFSKYRPCHANAGFAKTNEIPAEMAL